MSLANPVVRDPAPTTLLGIDTGGTFTDFVLFDNGAIRIHKVLSTPDAPERAIVQGLRDLGLEEAAAQGRLTTIHGSTVATNAALEGKGVATAFVTNRGFGDMLTIGRQARPELYNLQPPPRPVPVPADWCLETGGRIDHHGNCLEALDADELQALCEELQRLRPEAVAINLLYSFVDDRSERRIEAAIQAHFGRDPQRNIPFIARSSFVLPEYREYERGMATWLTAWLGPLISGYLGRLQAQLAPSPLAVMQSSGGAIDAGQAARRAVNLLLSGPAGGLAACLHIGKLTNRPKLISFDMGGTSTDVALLDGRIALTSEGRIGAYPVAVPMVDMQTIGAGGGSIAAVDQGGMLRVGPASAGASPGPACYGLGGEQATVTDANLALGRLRADAFLGGRMSLDTAAARAALRRLGEPLGIGVTDMALGIIRLANEHMSRALRSISIQRGHHPDDFSLCCFGGAGGLHVCELAENLGLTRAIIPAHAGVLSALGMLVAPRERQLSRTRQQLLRDGDEPALKEALQALAGGGIEELAGEGVARDAISIADSLDLRYSGQSYTLNVPWQPSVAELKEAFQRAHEERFGHRMEKPVELVNLRCCVSAPGAPIAFGAPESSDRAPQQVALPGVDEPVTVRDRRSLSGGESCRGPLLITETVSTTWIKPGWQVSCDRVGNLLLDRCKGEGNI